MFICLQDGASAKAVSVKATATTLTAAKEGPSALVRSFNVVLPILLLIIAIALNYTFGGKKSE